MVLPSKSLDIFIAMWAECRQRVGDTHTACFRPIRFTAHIDATGISLWQDVDVRHMSLFSFIGNNGPDFHWFVSMLCREDGPFLGNTRGGIQHVWIPAVYPELFSEWFKQWKGTINRGRHENDMRSCDLLGNKIRHSTRFLSTLILHKY